MEGCAFAKFGNSSGTEGEPSQKREKNGEKINAAGTGNRTRDPSITDQMSNLTNQVHLKVQFRHRFDQKCPFTESSVPLEITDIQIQPVYFNQNFVNFDIIVKGSVSINFKLR